MVSCKTLASDIIKLKPNGIFLSNGPGDPAATGKYAIPIIKELIKNNLPVFGICLGHQLLALALGAKTNKMKLGHRGANHPVKNLIKGNVEITSQNHGFEVVKRNLPKNVKIYLTISLGWIIFIGYLTWWNGLKSPMLDKSFRWDEWFWFGVVPAVSPYIFYYIWKKKE